MRESDKGSKRPGSEDPEAEAKLNNRANFLLAELGHFTQSLLQNEQLGEGRFRFFLTLITAVTAGLVALHTAKGDIVDKDALPVVVNLALIVLVFFGVLTYMRMLQRDRVSEGYKQDLNYIRNQLKYELTLLDYQVPFSPHISNAEDDDCKAIKEQKWPSLRGDWERTLRAGYSQTVGAVCALLLCMLALYDLHRFWVQSAKQVISVLGIDWLIKVIPWLGIIAVLIMFVLLCRYASHYAVLSRNKAKCHAEDNRKKAEKG